MLLRLGMVMIMSLISFRFSRSLISPSKTSFSTWRFGRKSILGMTSNSSPVRVRFAPSPTGSLHVGGARTALFNWLLAKKTDGTFIVRVEDTDEARSTRASEESILSDLTWMKLTWDEGPNIGGPHAPYRQSERKHIYKVVANDLIASGQAYPCFCSEDELTAKRLAAEDKGGDPKYDGTWRDADPAEVERRLKNGDPYTVRFKVPAGKIVSIDDVVRGKVSWDADASLGDFIIMRSNGMPVYNFCVAVDDADMRITHVIRAEEHLTNTLRQVLILEAMKKTPPTYAHCSLILGSDRSKLSKRHGATSLSQFRLDGYLPDAMMNYLANLGWNDGTDKEIFTPSELIKAFDLNRIVKSPAVFDLVKLKWINGQHLRSMALEDVKALVEVELQSGSNPILPSSQQAVGDAAVDAGPRLHFLSLASKIAQRDMELLSEATAIVKKCLTYNLNQTILSDETAYHLLNSNTDRVRALLVRDFEGGQFPATNSFATDWKPYIKRVGKELGLKGKELFHPLRLLLTGAMSGADVGDMLECVLAATDAKDKGLLAPDCTVHTMRHRMDILRDLNLLALKEELGLARDKDAVANSIV